MFDFEKDARLAVQEVRIEFGDLVGKKKDEVFVVLAEPDTFDCLKVKGKSKEELSKLDFLLGYFKEIFSKYLIDHSFTVNGVKADNDKVRDFIFRKIAISDYVCGEYFKAVFLPPQSKKEEK